MTPSASAASLVAAAERLAPAIRAARGEIERLRRLPPALSAATHEAQLFRLYIPKAACFSACRPTGVAYEVA
jgi:indole-3-acetate monooxygenase